MYKFLGIGAQKAGTTWLYEMLKQHPDLGFPLNKEAHYWDKKYPKLSPDDYFSHFISTQLIEGEITPSYSFLPLEVITEIHNIHPELKLIFIIRNPIDRAWSSAKMALERAEMTFEEASDQWFIDHFNSQGSLARGDYQKCISNWRSIFNYDQLLVLNFDDIRIAPQLLLGSCCDHLEIPCFNKQQFNDMHINHAIFSTSNQALNENLYSHLHKLYKNKISDLENYLSIDLSGWSKSD